MEPNCLPEPSRGGPGSPWAPWAPPLVGHSNFLEPPGGAPCALGEGPGELWAPKWRREGGKIEALGRGLALKVVSGRVFFTMFGRCWDRCSFIFIDLLLSFRRAFSASFSGHCSLARCPEFMFFVAARKRAHMLEILALPIDLNVFLYMSWPAPPRSNKK